MMVVAAAYIVEFIESTWFQIQMKRENIKICSS